MKSKEELHESVAQIMESFDFEAVQKHMIAVNWKWLSGTPSIEELRVTARSLLTRVISYDEPVSIGTGGFMAHNFDHGIDLLFYVSRKSY